MQILYLPKLCETKSWGKRYKNQIGESRYGGFPEGKEGQVVSDQVWVGPLLKCRSQASQWRTNWEKSRKIRVEKKF